MRVGHPKNHSLFLVSTTAHTFWFEVFTSQIFLKKYQTLIIYIANKNLFIIKKILSDNHSLQMNVQFTVSLRRIPL